MCDAFARPARVISMKWYRRDPMRQKQEQQDPFRREMFDKKGGFR
jgi:hypothetical protein